MALRPGRGPVGRLKRRGPGAARAVADLVIRDRDRQERDWGGNYAAPDKRTVERYAPKLLLLDPLIRLHRLSENDSQEISGLLGHLRELQRRHGVSIVLVHHASKRQRAHPGQSLRDSSDLHAWTDTTASS